MSCSYSPCKIKIKQPVREVLLGSNLTIGKENALPFVTQDGEIPNKTRIAVEIHDCCPDKYPELLKKQWGDIINNPVKWALKAKEIGADLIALRIDSAKQLNRKPEDIVDIAKQIIDATQLPLCILGINNRDIDKEYLPEISAGLKGNNCLIGPVEEETYKAIIPSIRDNGHCVIARTPIDINLAKQLNILISEMGLNPNKIIMDPNMGGLGYGLDYGYSVVEKIRLAAFDGDNMLNMPIVVFSGEEAWRTKEAKANINDDAWGNPHERSTLWETLTTSSMIMVGADLVIMRYPESIKHISNFLKRL